MDIFDQIATGVRPPPPGSNYTSEAQPSMQEQCFGYALAKQVPAMERALARELARQLVRPTAPPAFPEMTGAEAAEICNAIFGGDLQ